MMMMLMMAMKSADVDAGKTSLMTAMTIMDGGDDDEKSLRMIMVMILMMVAKILMEDDA